MGETTGIHVVPGPPFANWLIKYLLLLKEDKLERKNNAQGYNADCDSPKEIQKQDGQGDRGGGIYIALQICKAIEQWYGISISLPLKYIYTSLLHKTDELIYFTYCIKLRISVVLEDFHGSET